MTDGTGSPQGFSDGSNHANDYGYDNNGNMVTDLNKDITLIHYNHLNLPTKIEFGNGDKIYYFYNATGQKVSKEVVITATSETTTTDYQDGYQYTGNILNFFPHAEGYVNVTYCESCQEGSQYIYNYAFNYTDHLGNIRMSYGMDPATNVLKILEQTHYYPFGLKHTNYNSDRKNYDLREANTPLKIKGVPSGVSVPYKYKYNGKEFQDELGLNVYDYGARMYDPAIGRWPCIDPQAELLERSSPYVYALNSPLVYVDNDGELPILINGKTTSDAERADVSYWTASIVNTIKNSGIANPGGDVHYVDGNRGHSWSGKVGGYATKDDNVVMYQMC